VELSCNSSGRKLDPRGMKRYRRCREKDKEVGKRGRREI